MTASDRSIQRLPPGTMAFVLFMLCLTIGMAVSMRLAEWVLLSLWYGIANVWQERLYLTRFNPGLRVSNGDLLPRWAGVLWFLGMAGGGISLLWPLKRVTQWLVPQEYRELLNRNHMPQDYGGVGFILSMLVIGVAWFLMRRAPWVSVAEWAAAILLVRWDAARRHRTRSSAGA